MKRAKNVGSVSIGENAFDGSKLVARAIEALDEGDVEPAKRLLSELLEAAKAL